MIILTRYLLLTALLFSCSSNQQSVKEDQADILYAKGSSELINAEYTNALISLKKANDLRPKDSKILNNLGMTYYFKNDLVSAKKHLEQSISADKENMDAKSNLAAIHMQENNLHLAEKMYLEITKDLTYQNQHRVLHNLGVIEVRKNNDQKAIAYFEESLKVDSNFCSANYQLGLIYKKQKKYNLAMDSLKAATKGDCYQYPAPHYAQALTLLESGQYQNAQIKLKHVINAFPKSDYAKAAKEKLTNTTTMVIPSGDNANEVLDLPISALEENVKYENKTVKKNNTYTTPNF